MTNSTFICKFKYHLTLPKRTWLNSLNYWKRHLKYFPNRNLLLASFPLFSIVMSVQWLVYYFYWICMCVHSDWFKSVCVVICIVCMSDVNSYELRVFTTLETAKEKLKLISLLWWVFKKRWSFSKDWCVFFFPCSWKIN